MTAEAIKRWSSFNISSAGRALLEERDALQRQVADLQAEVTRGHIITEEKCRAQDAEVAALQRQVEEAEARALIQLNTAIGYRKLYEEALTLAEENRNALEEKATDNRRPSTRVDLYGDPKC